jgi:sulfate transport system permease protein
VASSAVDLGHGDVAQQAATAPGPAGGRSTRGLRLASAGASRGIAVLYASLLVLLPLAAVTAKAFDGGFSAFLSAVRQPESLSAIELTFASAAGVAVLNCVVGTAVAWVLVRDQFPGKAVVDAVVDLPLALPTIVAGVVLLSLYGPDSPVGLDIAFTRTAIIAALAFVTLPFSVRAVQPVIAELDRDAEQAAASLGAGPLTIFRRIILPGLLPALLTGAGLSFARALGEYGSVVLLSGNLPFHTELASVRIFGLVESGTFQEAAAVSVVLLAGSLAVLSGFSLVRRHVLPGDATA